MRWITLLWRIGTVALAIGLALLVAWLIPSSAEYPHRMSRHIEPEQYMFGESRVYSPQNGLQISVEATDKVRVYLLGVSSLELDNWKTLLREAYPDSESPDSESPDSESPDWVRPDMETFFIEFYTVPLLFFHEAYPEETHLSLNDSQTWDMMWDLAVLDKGLQTHPEIILWGPPPGSTFSHELFPEGVLNIMAVVANPSSDMVEVDIEIKEVVAVAPKDRIIFPAQLLISIGIGLTIVWLVSRSQKKFEKALSDKG
jgi:hypothetical protein